ncbi:MAG TPA: hypothetical protein VEH31_28460 [Streptosporangiaceae bacterium]|nr:hypothetical protein [Streptosporangiaceae bacterium]
MSHIRIVLVGRADMLQDVIRQVVNDDPALMLVGEVAMVQDLPALWGRTEADVVVVRSLSAEVPTAVLPTGTDVHIPAVLGIDDWGTRGVIVLDDISRTRLATAIHAAAMLRGRPGAGHAE